MSVNINATKVALFVVCVILTSLLGLVHAQESTEEFGLRVVVEYQDMVIQAIDNENYEEANMLNVVAQTARARFVSDLDVKLDDLRIAMAMAISVRNIERYDDLRAEYTRVKALRNTAINNVR